MEKRKHRKGFHISWNKKQRSSNKKSSEEPILLSSKQKSTEDLVPTNRDGQSVSEVTVSNQIKEQPVLAESQHNKKTIHSVKAKRTNRLAETNAASNSENAQKNNKSSHSGYLYLLSVLAIPFAVFNKKRNYNVASWASEHRKKAQWIIGLSTATAFLSSYLIGRLWHFDTPELSLPIAMAMAGSGGATYLLSKSTRGRITGGMMLNLAANFGSFTLGTMRSTLETDSPYIMHVALIILLTLALTLLFIASGYLIAGLSCSLACNGYEFAAVALLVGGSYLISFLFMLGILNVYRKKGDEGRSFAKTAALTALIIIAAIAVLILILSFI